MSFLIEALSYILHIKDHLLELITNYGAWVYLILIAIIFAETGLVITPFLPGDSLLFAAGALAAKLPDGSPSPLNAGLLALVLTIAAIIGDAVNYHIGRYLGPQLKQKGKLRFVKQEYLDRTHKFYEKYGKSTIILARFVPIIRTFAPFLAGVGSMRYSEFAAFNVIGAILWVNSFIWAGYFFGNIPFVSKNFGLVIIAIMIISVIPLLIEFIKFYFENKAEARNKTGQ